MLARISPQRLPKSDCCPLAVPLRRLALNRKDVEIWSLWEHDLTIGHQCYAWHVLQRCFDADDPMHSACGNGDCYGVLLQRLTTFRTKRDLRCVGERCAYRSQQWDSQCVLRVEPDGGAEQSIKSALKGDRLQFDCGCAGYVAKTGVQQLRSPWLPRFLIVHGNTYAQADGLAAELCVSVRADDGPIDMQRIAVMHHAGHTPASGHHTATVQTVDGMAFHCNDAEVTVRPDLMVQPWQKQLFAVSRKPAASDAQFDLQPVQGNAGPHAVRDSGSQSDHDGPVHVPGRGDDRPAALKDPMCRDDENGDRDHGGSDPEVAEEEQQEEENKELFTRTIARRIATTTKQEIQMAATSMPAPIATRTRTQKQMLVAATLTLTGMMAARVKLTTTTTLWKQQNAALLQLATTICFTEVPFSRICLGTST